MSYWNIKSFCQCYNDVKKFYLFIYKFTTTDGFILNKVEQARETAVQNTANQFVSFSSGNEMYGIDVHRVFEVLTLPVIKKIPNNTDFVKGVFSLRGEFIPLLDLRKLFNHDENESPLGNSVIIIEVKGLRCGIIVDAVHDVIESDVQGCKTDRNTAQFNRNNYVDAILQHQGRLIIILHIDGLLNPEQIDMMKGS